MPRKAFIGALLLVICALPLGLITSVPRTDRAYVSEQEILPAVRLLGRQLLIRHARSFRYQPDGKANPGYFNAAYDLDSVRRVWFGLSPFGSWQGPAHAFLSFEFADGRFLAISVEARKEEGESYSPWRGLLRGYELMYVVADEVDVIGLRSVVYRDPVYLYPGRATPAQAAQLLQVLLLRAEELRSAPEYYNTLTNNCATNLAAAVNGISPGRVPWNHALLLPGFSDEFAYELGLLALDRPPAAVRERYRVDEVARRTYSAPGFSLALRRAIPPPSEPRANSSAGE
jgi:hypothetical protein